MNTVTVNPSMFVPRNDPYAMEVDYGRNCRNRKRIE